MDQELGKFSGYKLSGIDWEVLEGLQLVLEVSHLLNPWTSTHTQ